MCGFSNTGGGGPGMNTGLELRELRKAVEGMSDSLRSIVEHTMRAAVVETGDVTFSALSDRRVRRCKREEDAKVDPLVIRIQEYSRELGDAAMRLVEAMLAEGDIVITSDPYAGGRLIFKMAK